MGVIGRGRMIYGRGVRKKRSQYGEIVQTLAANRAVKEAMPYYEEHGNRAERRALEKARRREAKQGG